MQIHIETADRHTNALLQAALPFLEPGLAVLCGSGTVIFTDDETLPDPAHLEDAAALFVFYRCERWLADPVHKQLTEQLPYAALPWPVSIPALEESIRRLCRLSCRPDTEKPPEPAAGPLRLDPEKRTVFCGGASVRLTDKEYRILTILYDNRGNPVDKTVLSAAVWPEGIHGNVCEVNITHLRQKLTPLLGDGVIGSIRGKGYILRLP